MGVFPFTNLDQLMSSFDVFVALKWSCMAILLWSEWGSVALIQSASLEAAMINSYTAAGDLTGMRLAGMIR